MEPLIIEKTGKTPKVVLDKSNGIFSICGKSLPEDVMLFYGQVIAWLNEYLADPNPETVLVLELEYFNTASSKIIFEIIKMFKEPASKGINVKIQWRYVEDDEDSLECGQDYASLVNIPFDFNIIVG